MSEDRAHKLRRFFAGITEYAFAARLGVADPPLVDYLTEMLIRFVRSDAVFSVRSPRGERYQQLADLLLEAQQREGEARRHIHRHIGDFALFWTGVYPEVGEAMRKRDAKDALLDYREHGKRSYLIASTIPVKQEVAPSGVLQRLGEQFELCAYGLGEVRRQWEERDGEIGPAIFIN